MEDPFILRIIFTLALYIQIILYYLYIVIYLYVPFSIVMYLLYILYYIPVWFEWMSLNSDTRSHVVTVPRPLLLWSIDKIEDFIIIVVCRNERLLCLFVGVLFLFFMFISRDWMDFKEKTHSTLGNANALQLFVRVIVTYQSISFLISWFTQFHVISFNQLSR